jgi:flagellar biosynthetic protein FliR
MDLLEFFALRWILVFVLVLARTSGLMMVGPALGSIEVPLQIRGLLAVAAALVLTPHVGATVAPPATLIDLAIAVAAELLLGLALGLTVALLLAGVQMAGQLAGQASGIGMGEIYNPALDATVPLFGQLLAQGAVAVYLILGGHRWLFDGLLETYRAIPPGAVAFNPDWARVLAEIVSQGLQLGLRVAAPATAALLLATLVLGLIGRALPQLNVLSLGFALNALVTLAVLSTSFGALAYAFGDEVQTALENVVDALVDAGPAPASS